MSCAVQETLIKIMAAERMRMGWKGVSRAGQKHLSQVLAVSVYLTLFVRNIPTVTKYTIFVCSEMLTRQESLAFWSQSLFLKKKE